MRRLSILAVLLTGLTVAACGSDVGGPGWTYAPAPSATPAASADASAPASAEPSAPASAAPSPSAGETTSPSGEPSATVVTVTAPTGAATTGFEPSELEGPANIEFTLEFDNQDATAPHNVVLSDPSGGQVNIGDTALFTGPETRDYQVPALSPGAYSFLCQAHPTTMTGTLTLQ